MGINYPGCTYYIVRKIECQVDCPRRTLLRPNQLSNMISQMTAHDSMIAIRLKQTIYLN